MFVVCSIFSIDMGLHCLTFMGRHVENKKKVRPVRIMNNVGLNSKNITNSVGICNDSVDVHCN